MEVIKQKNFRATLSWKNGDNDEVPSLNDEISLEKIEKNKIYSSVSV